MKKAYADKECKCCGKAFTPVNAVQVYCPECRALGYGRAANGAKTLERAVRRSYKTHYDINVTVQENTCVICGKPIRQVIYRNRNVLKAHTDYCSMKCKSKARIQATKCAHCGKLMTETDDIHDTKGYAWFCSKECRTAAAWEKARTEGAVRSCPVCGKEFIRKKGTFCSSTCATAYQRGKPRKRAAAGERTEKPHAFDLEAERRNEQARKAARKKEEEAAYILENGLCSVCSVPYPDCERMSSSFRIIPDGARYCRGKIVICPKFATTQLKQLSEADLKQIAKDAFASAHDVAKTATRK